MNWKSRYVELLDQQEKQQQRYKRKNFLLVSALSNMGQLARGIDAASDEKLRAILALLRREKLKNIDLEPAVNALKKQTSVSLNSRKKSLVQISKDIQQLARQARNLVSSSEASRSLKQFEKMLSGKSKQYQEVPAILNQLVALHASAIKQLKNDNVHDKSFWSRWFSSTPDVKPASAGALKQLTPVGDSVKVQDKHDPGQRSTDLKHDDVIVLNELSDSLSRLMQQICPPDDVQIAYEISRVILGSSLVMERLPELINAVCAVVSATLKSDHDEFETFLNQLNSRLREANSSLLVSRETHGEEIEAAKKLSETIHERVERIRSSVSSASDLDELKMEVSANIDQMMSVLEVDQEERDHRQTSLSNELSSLADRVKEMEEATETAEVRIEEQRRIALTDSLTQIPNREAYNQRGTQELARWQRYERPLCLAICDIDLFKNVNDTYGHAAGDEVLKGVGEVLQQRMRESDFVSRYGGEEFVVLLTETEKEQAFHVMESVRESIGSSSYAWGEEKLSVTISIGIAEFRGKDSLESVFTRADRALYRAKDCGRNQSLLAE